MPVWKANPDLMDRLIAAQNRLTAPIDIVSFAGMCDSRDELQRHVERYEERVASETTLRPLMAAITSEVGTRAVPTTCIETINGDPDTALRLSFQIKVF